MQRESPDVKTYFSGAGQTGAVRRSRPPIPIVVQIIEAYWENNRLFVEACYQRQTKIFEITQQCLGQPPQFCCEQWLKFFLDPTGAVQDEAPRRVIEIHPVSRSAALEKAD